MDIIHIFKLVVLSVAKDIDIKLLNNGAFDELKSALVKWNNNLKKLEIIELMESVVFC